MFILQDNMLYALVGTQLVGVEVYTDRVLQLDNVKADVISDKAQYLTKQEVMAKFQIRKSPYKKHDTSILKDVIEDVKQKEVGDNDASRTTKKSSARKPRSK